MLATDTLTNPSRLTLSDAAKRGFGGYSTLRKKIASGELPAERVGRRYLIDESDLAALVTPVVGRPTERASINTAIDRIVATAPRLSREQRDRLASLDVHTEKGRANADALEKIVVATQAAIEKNAENGASQTDLNGILTQGHDKFVEVATAITGNAAEAQRLWDTYKLNPGVVTTLMQQQGAQQAQLEFVFYALRDGHVRALEHLPRVA